MHQKAYTYLIVMASIVLIGSTTVQALWIYQGYLQAEERLRQQLNQALTAATEELQTTEEIAFIAQLSEENEEAMRTQEVHIIRQEALRDSMINTEQRRADSLRHRAEQRVERQRMSTRQTNIQVYSYSGTDSSSIRIAEQSADSAIAQVMALSEGGRLRKLVRRIEQENLQEKRDWKNRLDSATFHELLIKHTGTRGIRDEVGFSITNTNGIAFSGFSTRGSESSKAAIEAKMPLFSNDLRSKEVYAVASIESSFSSVIADLGWMVFSSLLFTALMVALFVVVMRKLLSQSRLSRLKTDFINNMSHELKTPLATISLATDAMLHPTSQATPGMVEGFAKTIQHEYQRMHQHIDRVLEMAQSERGTFRLDLEPTRLFSLAEEVKSSMQLIAEKAGANIELEGEVELTASVDRMHLKSAITNLVDNSLKYNENQAEITIKVFAEGAWNCISVRDNGIGIAPEHQKQVFSIFFRVQRGYIHTEKGFGLGLSYVRLIAEAHGGKVELESDKGKGACFTLKLPLG